MSVYQLKGELEKAGWIKAKPKNEIVTLSAGVFFSILAEQARRPHSECGGWGWCPAPEYVVELFGVVPGVGGGLTINADAQHEIAEKLRPLGAPNVNLHLHTHPGFAPGFSSIDGGDQWDFCEQCLAATPYGRFGSLTFICLGNTLSTASAVRYGWQREFKGENPDQAKKTWVDLVVEIQTGDAPIRLGRPWTKVLSRKPRQWTWPDDDDEDVWNAWKGNTQTSMFDKSTGMAYPPPPVYLTTSDIAELYDAGTLELKDVRPYHEQTLPFMGRKDVVEGIKKMREENKHG